MAASVPFVRFALGGAVVLVPAIFLEQSGRRGWAWAYTLLILTMLAVFYSKPIAKASQFLSKQLKEK